MIVPPLAPLDNWTYDKRNRPLLRESLYNHYQIEKFSGPSAAHILLPYRSTLTTF